MPRDVEKERQRWYEVEEEQQDFYYFFRASRNMSCLVATFSFFPFRAISLKKCNYLKTPKAFEFHTTNVLNILPLQGWMHLLSIFHSSTWIDKIGFHMDTCTSSRSDCSYIHKMLVLDTLLLFVENKTGKQRVTVSGIIFLFTTWQPPHFSHLLGPRLNSQSVSH